MKPLSVHEKQHYDEAGYVIARQVIDQSLADQLVDHYMTMRAEGPKPGDSGGSDDQPDDPNHRLPRMINMHQWDHVTEDLVHWEDLRARVKQLIDDDAVMNQTMLYFKPPGARGQALHQDQQYITIEPLIGVWIALNYRAQSRANRKWANLTDLSDEGLYPLIM